MPYKSIVTVDKKPGEKKKNSLKVRLIYVCAILIAVGVIYLVGNVAYEKYKANKETELYQFVSEDVSYVLKVMEIGEISEPYGPTDCEFKLYKDDKLVNKYKFIVLNDGEVPAEDDFEVEWMSDKVKIIVSGEDQLEKMYFINYQK